MTNHSVNYNLPEPLIDWVAEYARRTTRTKSGVIRLAIESLAIRAGADMRDVAKPYAEHIRGALAGAIVADQTQ